MSLHGAQTQLDERNYYLKKTRTEYEFNRLAMKCALLTTALVITNILALIFLLLAYLPLPIPH